MVHSNERPDNLPQKELLIAVVEKEDAILMRKKPEGSEPYKETWYLFGCEPIHNQDNPMTLKNYLKTDFGIDVQVVNEAVSVANEIKIDHDGIKKFFIYINMRCKYLGGIPRTPKGLERVDWIPKNKLQEYDLVPPSVRLLKGLGYMPN